MSNSAHYAVTRHNDLASERHNFACSAFLDWVFVGKPRTGPEYEIMKRTQAPFKLALRLCKQNEEQFRCSALANDYPTDKGNFWRTIRMCNNSKMSDEKCPHMPL
jgi:hypothetical protein